MSLDDLRRRLRARRDRVPPAATREEAARAGKAEADTESRFEEAVTAARERRRRPPPPPPPAAIEELEKMRASRPGLAARLAHLDPWQLAAVLDPARSLLVRAQVGSGKTTVLIHRVLHLVLAGAARPERLLVMTFTNKAAAEIRERLRVPLVEEGLDPDRLAIGTFHSLCRGLLRTRLDQETSGRSRRFRLLDERARLDLLRELVGCAGLRIAYAAKLVRRLELFRRGETRFGNMKRDDDIDRLAALYEAEKRARDLLDFDDLIVFGRATARGLAPEDRPDWIVVDEFQDSDPEQLALLEDWRGAETGLFAVGDPDQVIYSWRGGSADLFADFARRFAGKELALPRNYRSSETILEAARFVLGPLAASHDLAATRGQGRDLVIRRHHDPVAEARHVAEEIRAATGERSIGILVRTREQLEPLREQLAAAGIVVHRRERRQGDDELADWLLAYLDWLAAGAPTAGALRVLGDPRFGFPGLADRRPPGRAEADSLATLLELALPDQEADRRFLLALVARARGALAEDFDEVEPLVAALGLASFLSPRSSRFEERRRRLGGFLAAALREPGLAWFEALRDLLALGEAPAEEPEEGPRVELMTMHAAKGLEFDRVFISGANQGMIPLASAYQDPEQEAEERRLLFVAMTRAKDELEIGWFARPPRASAQPEPSVWLSLIPERLLARAEAAVTEAPADGTPFGPGVAVRHARYGEGVVVAVAEGQVRCRFTRGERSFSLLMCPLEPID